MNDRKEINEIKEGLKVLLDRLETLENTIPIPLDPFDFFKVELPEDGERLYFIDNVQSTILSKIFDISNMNDVKRFENGLFFETIEEAKQHLKECKLLFTIKKWAKEKNDGWVPDWEKGNKYYIFYNYRCCEFETSSTVISDNFKKLPYFKSREMAQECIDIFGDEIKEVICNEVE